MTGLADSNPGKRPITAAEFWKAGARAMRDQGRVAAHANAQIAAERLDEIRRLEAALRKFDSEWQAC